MSSSEADSRGSGHIVVRASHGVAIELLDADLGTIEAGFGRIEHALPEGIYRARWAAGEQTEQRIVRLRDGETLELGPMELIPGARGGDDKVLAGRQFAVLGEHLAQDIGATTTVLLFVCASDLNTNSDVAGGISLLQPLLGSSRAMRRLEPFYRHVHIADGWTLLEFAVEPGNYLLRFVSSDRATLEQAVSVLPGCRMLCWLRYSRTARAETQQGEAKLRSRRGVDPSRSLFLPLPARASTERLSSDLLFLDVLLHHLSRGMGELDDALVQNALQFENPLLRLYTACALLTRPRHGDELWPETTNAMATPARNYMQSMELIAPLLGDTSALAWPDLLCARWRIAMAREETQFPQADQSLAAPPLLEANWQWASAWSVHHAVINPSNAPGMRALLSGQVRSTPWLTWRSTDDRQHTATADPTSEASRSSEAPSLRLESVVEISDSLTRGVLWRSLLPSKTADLAETIQRVGQSVDWSAAGQTGLSRLAGATGLSVGVLGAAVDGIVNHLRSDTAQSQAASEISSSDDPHKGCFGGLAEREGVSLRLINYKPTNDDEFLVLSIAVEFAPNAGRPRDHVTFFLHPTFNPAIQVAAVIDGRAMIDCFAWGAFTVGAQTGDSTKLELDLADDPSLPDWFRER
ncbi:pYEATS domain-containing protein [Labrys sp. KB_33_2]|uniref:pYEATS domain-containing protein n=1 Tax=Labrys sp. KB_33_2 TaxID=3237479 RepID=UPI003F9326C6